jgi:acyl-CoA synthetase (AMP-forming)/AMP-acid ligase II
MLLHDYLSFHAHSRGDHLFARMEGRDVTFREAWERSGHLASVLRELGVGAGVRFGILMRNSPDMLLLVYAASRCGAVPVPLNYRLAPTEWTWILEDAEAVALVADIEFAEACQEALPTGIHRVLAAGSCEGWIQLQDLTEQVGAFEPSREPMSADVLMQMYTSGTTGRPKGALLSQANILANLHQNLAAMPYKLSPGERALVVLPLFHVAALVTALNAVSSGAAIVIHADVDPRAIAAALVEDGIAVATLVPSVIQFVLQSVPGIDRMQFPRLKLLMYGASPIAEGTLRRALEVFDCHFVQGYGMTELSGAGCLLTETDHDLALKERPELLMSTGRPLPGTRVRVVGADDQDLPVGEIGEILVQGPQVMSGYWRLPEETRAALAGGWLHTGDAGYLDDAGYLFIRDRVKDMIVSGGENVYPAEIEAVLLKHPAVTDAAVIGVPDDRWGETVMAVIVSSNESPAAEELDQHCRSHLGGFKVPRRYQFVESLPRNSAGKVLKRELRNTHWPSEGRQVG